ncbi:hypothetical protein [Mycobacteroides chelonae]|uniref:hypothetical protein n=1 Tax=Mycobacteroides chelonae TaxID=1774 RepID=UPI0009937D34|nr:hypothetical protein [Mycobacteroides chelonae]
MQQTTTPEFDDPGRRGPTSWVSRKAALKSRNVPDDDPRIIECDAALAYWKCRRIIDTQRELLDPRHIPALADMLRHEHQAVSQ